MIIEDSFLSDLSNLSISGVAKGKSWIGDHLKNKFEPPLEYVWKTNRIWKLLKFCLHLGTSAVRRMVMFRWFLSDRTWSVISHRSTGAYDTVRDKS